MNFKDSESIRAEKRFLKRYIKNEACRKRLEEKVATLENRMKGLKAVTISDMPRGGSPISLEDLLIQKEELLERINRVKKKSDKYRKEILAEIDQLDDEREVEILESYYLEDKDIVDIAIEIGYHEKTVGNIFHSAIVNLALLRQKTD